MYHRIMLLVVFMLIIAWYIFKSQKKAPETKAPPYRPTNYPAIAHMTAREFEFYCASWLQQNTEYRTEVTRKGGDGNIDMFVRDDHGVLVGIAECKHWNHPVTHRELKILTSTMDVRGVSTGWFFSLEGYNRGAKNYCHNELRGKTLHLLTGQDIAVPAP